MHSIRVLLIYSIGLLLVSISPLDHVSAKAFFVINNNAPNDNIDRSQFGIISKGSSRENEHTYDSKLSLTEENIFSNCTPTPGCIGGCGFIDTNCNGVLDLCESGSTGLQVSVYDCQNQLINTTLTDTNGDWQVCGLTDGEAYRVEYIVPVSMSTFIAPSQMGADNDSDIQFHTAPTCSNFGVSYIKECETVDPNAILQPGYAVASCFSGAGNNSASSQDPNGFVLGVFDITDPVGNAAPSSPTNWANPAATAYHDPTWISSNMGEIFGLAIEEGAAAPDIFAIPTGVTFNRFMNLTPMTGGTGGEVFRIDGTTGAITLLTTLPSTTYTHPHFDMTMPDFEKYVGLGQVTYNKLHDVIYVSNLDNGLIYVIDANTGATIDVFDNLPGTPDDPALSFTQHERTIFGIGYNSVENRLYYAEPITIYDNYNIVSVAILPDGSIDDTSKQTEFVFNVSDPTYDTMISDISFSEDGQSMLLAEMSMEGNPSLAPEGRLLRAAHQSTIWEYEKNNCLWSNTIEYFVGLEYSHTNVEYEHRNGAGGVDYGYNNFGTNSGTTNVDDAIVSTGEFLEHWFNSGDVNIYGLQIMEQGVPSDTIGANVNNSYYVDIDGQTGAGENADKYTLGDVEVRGACLPQALEIGNYVWCDSLQNGLQDACERGISGMNVQLFDAAGLHIGQTVTADGNYSFNQSNVDTTGITLSGNIASPNTNWSGLSYDTKYYIVYGDGQFAGNNFTIGAESYPGISTNDVGSNDNIDSDVASLSTAIGSIPAGLPFTCVNTNPTGCADHKYDLGLLCVDPCPDPNCYNISITRN